MNNNLHSILTLLLCMLLPAWAHAETIGTIKLLDGQVNVERGGTTLPAKAGDKVFVSDVIITGADGSVGVLFEDDSRVSAGPNSVLSLDDFVFNKQTHEGNFDVSMRKGTLSAISGKLTEKKPGAMRVKTPAAILAVRGTEFSIKVEDPNKTKDQQ